MKNTAKNLWGFHGSGKIEKYVVQKFPFAIRFITLIFRMRRK